MSNKKYSIVRVDDKFCPSHFEKIDDLNVCIDGKNLYTDKLVKCKNCRYGLTKKQLIQIVRQSLKNNFKRGTTFLYLAEKIINDLGV